VTSHEVARRAGVSRATVSYVLNGAENQRISADTRARVLAVADQLGYRPSAAALALRNGHSDIVLVALPPWPHGPVIVDAIDAAVAELRTLGYTPLVHFDQPEDAALAETCARIQPLGVIAPGDRVSKAFVTKLKRNRAKGVVAIDVRPLEYVSTVVVRQEAIGRAAVEYLKARGHTDVLAYMPADIELAAARIAGARSVRGVRVRVASTLDDIDGITAIYAFNDEYAFVAMRTLVDRRIRIPDEIALIGTDDIATAALVLPALTTVRIDGAAFGITLAHTLDGAIKGKRATTVDFLHPEVVVRESA
jgi:DNA-binding LacI/PurR family transcriptional regulator